MLDKKSVFVVVFEAYVNGKLARVEVPTQANPMNSRQVRKDCEHVARASFAELARAFNEKFGSDKKVKAVECIEVPEPDGFAEKERLASAAKFN
jgi:hypothetical protein